MTVLLLMCTTSYLVWQPDDRSARDHALTVELDRSSPVPLYFQLAQAIEAAILDGELEPGDRFENELALAKRLNLSRPTTRRAIQEMVDKGMLVRKRGVGTQVVQNAGPPPRRTDQPVRRPRPRRPGADNDGARLPRRDGVRRDRRGSSTSQPDARRADDAQAAKLRWSAAGGDDQLSARRRWLPTAEELGAGRALSGPARARCAHPAGPPAHRRQDRRPGGGAAARREAEGAAAGHEPHGVRRLGQGRRVRQPRAIARRATTSKRRSSTASPASRRIFAGWQSRRRRSTSSWICGACLRPRCFGLSADLHRRTDRRRRRRMRVSTLIDGNGRLSRNRLEVCLRRDRRHLGS